MAWPFVSRAFDGFLGIGDERARTAMRLLAKDGVVAGETGAAGVAGLIELMEGGTADALGVGADTPVLILCTEGATDPVAYREIVGA